MRNETQRFVLNDKWTVIYNKSMAFKWKWMAHFQVEKTHKKTSQSMIFDENVHLIWIRLFMCDETLFWWTYRISCYIRTSRAIFLSVCHLIKNDLNVSRGHKLNQARQCRLAACNDRHQRWIKWQHVINWKKVFPREKEREWMYGIEFQMPPKRPMLIHLARASKSIQTQIITITRQSIYVTFEIFEWHTSHPPLSTAIIVLLLLLLVSVWFEASHTGRYLSGYQFHVSIVLITSTLDKTCHKLTTILSLTIKMIIGLCRSWLASSQLIINCSIFLRLYSLCHALVFIFFHLKFIPFSLI